MPSSKPLPQKRKATTAFKPPRPANRTAKTTKPAARRKSAPARARTSLPSSDENDDDEEVENVDEDDDDEDDSSSISAPDSQSDPPPMIPPSLLNRLIHHTSPDKNMRIGKDAMGVVGKYMETFVREAIARAALERQEELDKRREKGERIGPGEGFLDVSVLVHCFGD